MAVRIKDGMIPYTWWIGIEITDNHVINVLLREMNNLIHVNEDRELYVDLQLDNWIRPDDNFPVWVTTGKILEEDWWQQNGLILNWKTTSWDYNRLIYANDWNLYIDLWDGVWRLFGGGGWWGWILECNTKTFYVTKEVVDPDTGTTSIVVDMEQLQDAVDWYFDWKNPILWYQDWMYVFERESSSSQVLYFVSTHLSQVRFESRWTAFTDSDRVVVYVDADTKQITGVHQDVAMLSNNPSFIPANYTLRDPFMATQPSHPISLAYLNQQLALKQGTLVPWQNITIDPNTNEISAVDTTYTAWTRITIDQNNVISADISGVMTYMWNVTDPSQLPASWNQWDCWYSESDWHLYSWNGTQWNDIGWVTPSMTQFFNKTTDDSDDIHEWNTNLFVSPNEKNTWNAKQDQIIAGNNITINPDWKTINATDTTYTAWTWISIDQNNEISADPYVWWNWITVSGNTITNDAPFEPENTGTMGQYLKKRNNGKYEWADVPQWWSWTSYSAWDWINIDSNNEISNTKPFDPINDGQMGQVLTKTADRYYWKTPQWWGGAEYTAGYGLNLNGNEFSVDTTEIATQWDLAWKQDTLVAGQNITIDPNTNEISATWGGQTYTAWYGLSLNGNEFSVDTSDIATQSDLSNKQDTISDLSDIRNDAQEWASAYTTIQNYWDIVTHNASEFATSTQWWKADTALQPWDNITELVNNAGYITWISSSDVTGALWYTPYDSSNPSWYITGISSWDVTTALWYTPYDSSNPSGYITDSYHDSTKQDTLTAWSNIQINNNVISATDTTYNAWLWIKIGDDFSAMQWPAPLWFHIPLASEWEDLWWILTDVFWLSEDGSTMETYLKMPLAGGRSYAWNWKNSWLEWYYWCAWMSNGTTSRVAECLDFRSNYINYQYLEYPWEASSIRCFKNVPVVPDATWSVLYNWSSVAAWAWVFHNLALWLISISWDWTTWYTIHDKNLWAKFVYNSWDTLGQDNCWWCFQWGNDYMFELWWQLSDTSPTAVDASEYWPLNHYSSSTFITKSLWDSSRNRNLWGGVTWIVSNAIINTLIPDENTKTFYLYNWLDLANAQAAYNWVSSWLNAIIQYNWKNYFFNYTGNGYVAFTWATVSWTNNNSDTKINKTWAIFIYQTSWTVTSITIYEYDDVANVLATNVDYATPYTPQYDGSPATKKYVDDKVGVKWVCFSNPAQWHDLSDMVGVLQWWGWVWLTNGSSIDWRHFWDAYYLFEREPLSRKLVFIWDNMRIFIEYDASNICTSHTRETITRVITSWTSPTNPELWQIWYNPTSDSLQIYWANWWKTITMS